MPGTLATHLAVQEFPCIFCFLGVTIDRFRAGHAARGAGYRFASTVGVGDVDFGAAAQGTGTHLNIQ